MKRPDKYRQADERLRTIGIWTLTAAYVALVLFGHLYD